MNDLRHLMIIQYDVSDFQEDHPNMSEDQLRTVLTTLEADMDYSMIDEHIRSEFYELAEELFPEVFGEVSE